MSSEGFGYEEEGAGTSSAGGGAGKPKGREIRHRMKAPWCKEALAGRVLSEGGRGPPMPGGGQEWPDMGWGSYPHRGLFSLPWGKAL